MITSLDQYDLDGTPIQFEMSERERELRAAERACGVIRAHFGGRLVAEVNSESSAHLQDALKARVDDILPFVENEDKILGTSDKKVKDRVVAGLKLLTDKSSRAGLMRLEGGYESMTGLYVIHLKEGKRNQRRPPSNDWYCARQQRARSKLARELKQHAA